MREYQRKWAIKNPDKIRAYIRKIRQTPKAKARYRAYHLRYNYGITPEKYDEMFKTQQGKCALCGGPPGKRGLFVDHDHRTKKVRGLLCDGCNWAVGAVEARAGLLGIYIYLQRGGKN
jgi:hypothetical protein